MEAIQARKYHIIESVMKIDSEAVLAKIEAFLNDINSHSTREEEENIDTRMEKAAVSLLGEYENDEELTAFTVLDGEDFYEYEEE
jgi:hypothetical protein